MLGYVQEEFLGRSSFDFTFAEDRSDFEQRLAERRQGLKGNDEFRLRRKDGSELWVQNIYTPLLDERGEFIGAFAILTNIGERKRAEEERKRAESKLRLLSAASATLAASLDFKTTLENLTRVVVPEAADLCVIDLVSEDGRITVSTKTRSPRPTAVWIAAGAGWVWV
jgi:PAS domain S-box-containing protein